MIIDNACIFGSASKESACNAGDLGSILGLGRYPGEGKGYPLQYSGLENSMDSIVHGVTVRMTEQFSLSLSLRCLLPMTLQLPHGLDYSCTHMREEKK